jgi:hypothetical protein
MIIRITSAVLTLAGALALLSGLLFWLGWALQLMSLHMLLGILAVAALWTIGFAQVSVVTGILTLLLGLYQASLLVGPLHWIARVVHLILGLATIGLGHMAAARFRKTVQ